LRVIPEKQTDYKLLEKKTVIGYTESKGRLNHVCLIAGACVAHNYGVA